MGPRPRGRGITGEDGAGGGHLPASMGPRPPKAPKPAKASMGPRPRGRGIRVPVNQIVTIDPLQWGRDRAVAEFGPNCPTIRFRFRFNGATARSRNSELHAQSRRVHRASMGPRPRGRGIITHQCLVPRSHLLQWGRDRAVAELSPSRVIPSFLLSSFNGAATARSRNSPQHLRL